VARRLCAVVDIAVVDINILQQDGRLLCISSVRDGELDPAWTGQYEDLADYAVHTEVLESGAPAMVQSLDDPRLTPQERAINQRFGEQSWLSLPLIAKDRVIGIVDLIETRAERRFSEGETATALAVCQVAALAIDNAAVYDRLEETARRMTLMTEAGLEFSSSLDLQETLLAVGRRLCDAVGVPHCDINILRGDHIECLMSIVDGESDLTWTGTSHLIADYSGAGEVIDERKVVKITSIDDPRVTGAGRISRTAYGEKSWVAVPLVVKDRVLGMVDLSETRFERDFSDEDIAAAQAICRVAALAIDNADLFADVQARTAETDMLNAIARKATATSGLHEMIVDVSDELRQVVPFARSSLALIEKDELVFYRPHTEEAARLELSAYGEAALDFRQQLMVENVVRLRLPEEGNVWADFPDLDGVRSAIAVSLRADGRMIGALNLLSSQADAFAEADTDLLARVGTQVSLAIKNILLYRDVKGMHINNLRALSAALNAKDYYTLGHAARVSAYMVLLGQKLGWPADLLTHLEEAAFLHDIGKISISDRVLLKPGKLNAEEWDSMKQHPVFSAEIIHTLFEEDLVLGVRHHHERWDGTGYPDGLSGVQVPVIARAMCVVDAYDAMSFRRPYRNALGAEECVAELQRCRGAQFAPELCDAFLEVLGELNERRQTATRIAAEAAARIDPAKHALLLSPEDEGRPEYSEIAGILRDVRDANPPTRFLTTQARLDRRYVIVVDCEQNESERSPLGADIFPDEILQVLPQALAGEEPRVNALFADQFGVWVTGLAPIRDAHGETIAVVAADLPPFAGAESGGLRAASQDSLVSILQTAVVHSSLTDLDTISDGLTGLYNHRYLHERLREELVRAGEAKAPLSLLLCDIDHFALFNEELGHRAGDNALRSVAHVLEQSIRNVDLAARFGGEEFVVALLETDARGAFEVAERIRERVHETWIAPSQDPLSISIGVATFPGDGQTKEELLDKADWAMHVAKRQGRNRVVAFSPPGANQS
jgi:diguanylate cyclase (GGDEF)-like protein